jgi:hypothetical protein
VGGGLKMSLKNRVKAIEIQTNANEDKYMFLTIDETITSIQQIHGKVRSVQLEDTICNTNEEFLNYVSEIWGVNISQKYHESEKIELL